MAMQLVGPKFQGGNAFPLMCMPMHFDTTPPPPPLKWHAWIGYTYTPQHYGLADASIVTTWHGRSHHRGNGGSCLLTSEQLIFPIKAHRAWSHPPIKMKRRLPAVSCSKVGASSSNKSSQPPSLECGRIQKKTCQLQ